MNNYIELPVRVHSVIHGYDNDNQLIIESIGEKQFINKLIAIRRIESVSQEYLLVKLTHGRVAYWEYDESYEVVASKLKTC